MDEIMTQEIFEEDQIFDFCKKVDLNATSPTVNLETVVAIAAEHGFRGCAVTLGKIQALVKEINKPISGDKSIVPICYIDYPAGTSSLDVRCYSIQSAKEKGAKEIEIAAPYDLFATKDFKGIYDDIKTLSALAQKADLEYRYVVDISNKYIENINAKLCNILSTAKVPWISIIADSPKKKSDYSDNILKMRNIKTKVGCNIKMSIDIDDPADLAAYVKAGADSMGILWCKAPSLVHGYEDIIQKKAETE